MALIMGTSIWEKLRLAAAGKSTRNAVRAERAVKGDDKITQILKYLRKFAVDESLKGVAGGVLVDKLAKEGPDDETVSNASTNQNNKLSFVVAEEMRARVNCVEPQTTISTHNIHELDCFDDLPKEPVKGSSSSKTAPNRIMIRSRL